MKIFEIINKNIKLSLDLKSFRKPKLEKDPPIVTISRERGAGGSIIAERLAKKLGGNWDYFNKDIIEGIAKESDVSIEKIQEVDEKNIPYLEDVLKSWVGKNYYSLNDYSRTLIKVLLKIGSRGNVIIVGRGASFLFKNSLKVRVIADEEYKLYWVMKEQGLNRKEAERIIKKVDKERQDFIAKVYHKDAENPKYFDLIIKIGSKLSIDDAVNVIACLVKKRFQI